MGQDRVRIGAESGIWGYVTVTLWPDAVMTLRVAEE